VENNVISEEERRIRAKLESLPEFRTACEASRALGRRMAELRREERQIWDPS
jgi:hypothetical protein